MDREYVEVLNVKVGAGSRTLYVDLKENPDGTRFLSISEVRASKTRERSRILIDEEHVAELHRALDSVLEFLSRKSRTKAYSIPEKRRERPRAYERWTRGEEEQLVEAYDEGCGVSELAERHARAPTAVLSRLYQLGVLKHNERPRWD